MSERSGGGLTPGDPLGGGDTPPAERQGGLWSGNQGYTSPAPPGAGGPAPSMPAHPPGLAGRPALASWGSRAVAQIVDGIIIFIGAVIVLAILAALGLTVDTDGGAAAFIVTAFFAVLAIAIVALLYAPVLMSRTNGQTLGRMVVNIRVIRTGGEPVTFWFAVLREVLVKSLLVGALSSATFGLAWLLDVLWPLWDEENRALHDFVVGTRVVKA
jgi:uncharacterized RDD family membrane protein YckC